FDYTGYKRPSLMRRFQKRVDAVGAESYQHYREHLEANPGEFGELFNTILINVTSFFRDRDAWDYVAADIVPQILDHRGQGPMRVWSAGCASGEEAYTVAMILAEAMGESAFRDRVKIYATDVDEHALTQARHAVYTPKQLLDVPEELRDRYFQEANGGLTF